MTKAVPLEKLKDLLDLNTVQARRMETLLTAGLLEVTGTSDLSGASVSTEEHIFLRPERKPLTGRLTFPYLKKPTQDTPKDEAAASTAATPLDQLRSDLKEYARPRMDVIVALHQTGDPVARLMTLFGLTDAQEEIEGHIAWLREISNKNGILRQDFNQMAADVLRELKDEFTGEHTEAPAEKHDKTGPLTFDTLDVDGYSPELGLLKQKFRHTGNGKVYTIRDFTFNGATDQWNFVMFAKGENVPVTRPMEHLTGNRENGKPRYEPV